MCIVTAKIFLQTAWRRAVGPPNPAVSPPRTRPARLQLFRGTQRDVPVMNWPGAHSDVGGTASLEGSRCTSSGAFSSVLATPETSRPHRKRDLVLYPAWADASSVTPRGRRERVMAVARLRLHLAVAGPLQFSARIGIWSCRGGKSMQTCRKGLRKFATANCPQPAKRTRCSPARTAAGDDR